MWRGVTGALICVVSINAGADDGVLTLDLAVGIALENNPTVQNAQLQSDAVGDEVDALKTRRLPAVDLRGGVSEHLIDQNYKFDEGVWGNDVIGPIPRNDVEITSNEGTTSFVSADVIQPLSQLYEIGLSIEQGEVKQEMAYERSRLAQQDIASLVKRNYFGILRTQGDLESTEESVVYYQALDTLVTRYVEQKIALQYQLLDVQARLAKRQMQAVAQENRLINEKQQMNKLLGRSLATPFTVAQLPPPASLPLDLDGALNKGMAQRPDVLNSKMRVKSAELSYDLKKAEYIPDVDLMLRYSRLYGTELIPDGQAYVGLQAKWEIIDWGRKRKELSGANAKIQMATNRVRATEEKARLNIDRSFRAIGESIGFVEVAKLSQAAARDKLRVLTNQYRQQSALLKDVLDAESELARANAEYNRAVLGIWQARADFNRAMGEI